jgi:hypothetical protein
MDKGIRVGVNFEFNNKLADLPMLGGKAFRKYILEWAVENYGVTWSAACTHYNFAKHEAMKVDPTLSSRLGRAPEKNNGGRKKKSEFVGPMPLTVKEVIEFVDAESVVQETFNVKKKSDGSVVAEGLSFEDARTLVSKAAAQKKAKLYWV